MFSSLCFIGSNQTRNLLLILRTERIHSNAQESIDTIDELCSVSRSTSKITTAPRPVGLNGLRDAVVPHRVDPVPTLLVAARGRRGSARGVLMREKHDDRRGDALTAVLSFSRRSASSPRAAGVRLVPYALRRSPPPKHRFVIACRLHGKKFRIAALGANRIPPCERATQMLPLASTASESRAGSPRPGISVSVRRLRPRPRLPNRPTAQPHSDNRPSRFRHMIDFRRAKVHRWA